jgi:L-fuculose-phosphate aldolase
MDINAAKKAVLAAGVKLVEAGLIARTWGNVSCRVDEDSFIITPSGRSYRSLTPADLVQVKVGDLSYQGEIKPSSEKRIHATVYQLHPEMNFVIHTHQDNASVIAASELKEIEVGGEYSTLGRRVICAKYALPGTKALQKRVRTALEKPAGQAVIMKHHGVLCYGIDADETFMVASELEKACADFVINHYLKQSKATEYNPADLVAFALGPTGKAGVVNVDQGPKNYGQSRRTDQGIIWDDGEKELKIFADQSLVGLPEEVQLHQRIYNNNKQINQINFKTTPEIRGVASAGLTLKPLLDDFAQIIGVQVKTVEAQNYDEIAQALSKSAAVLLKNHGALCCGETDDDVMAVGMILQKSCQALIGASLFGKVRPINLVESRLMRYVYRKKYSKQAERNR